MKKNILYFVLLSFAALFFVSCISDIDPVTSPDEVLTPIRISATYSGNGAPTRVTYTEDDANITAKWQAGDQIYVCYNGHVNTLTLTEGAGTATATFDGTIQGTPSASSVLICYVRDANNPSAINVSGTGEYTYTSGTFTSQDGTLAGAAKCNVYYSITTYGTGGNLSCTFNVNTSILKFSVVAPDGVNAGDAATLTYKTGGTELVKASFTVGAEGKNTIYMAVPAGQYTGAQTLTYKSGEAEVSKTLSVSKATFTAGQTYSRALFYKEHKDLSMLDNAGNPRDEQWTANCYMIHTAGSYKLPLVYGNAIKNGEANTAAYTGIENANTTLTFPNHAGNAIDAPWITKSTSGSGVDKGMGITVSTAELLWQDAQGLILAVGIDGDYLTLTVGKDATTQEGNALVAAKDDSGNIVWSWHIWVTRQTFAAGDLINVNTGSHTYSVAPVNLGWVGDVVSMGYNTYYQWGRKDAFIPGSGVSDNNDNHVVYNIKNQEVTGFTYTVSTTSTIADNIKNPTVFYQNSSTLGPCNTRYYNMWDAQQTSDDNDIATATVKTVYDPCPAGFCVPTIYLYTYIASSEVRVNFTWDGTHHGRTLTIGTQSLYFPATGYRPSAVSKNGWEGKYFSATPFSTAAAWNLEFDNNDSNTTLWGYNRYRGLSVRAVAEE